jgi:hypothetical protein
MTGLGRLVRHPGAAPWWVEILPGRYASLYQWGHDDDVYVLHADAETGWALVIYTTSPRRAFVCAASELRLPHQWIRNTDEPRRQPWPAGMFVQGGDRGVVFSSAGGGYLTAFVECDDEPGGFIRGEAPNVECAERVAYLKYLTRTRCPGHEYEARDYTNGAGFCRRCDRFAPHVFTGEQLGQHCSVCGVGTTFGRYSPAAYWDADQRRAVNPGEDREWRCETHAPFREEFAAYRARLASAFREEI